MLDDVPFHTHSHLNYSSLIRNQKSQQKKINKTTEFVAGGKSQRPVSGEDRPHVSIILIFDILSSESVKRN
jgi:hypothetical protein